MGTKAMTPPVGTTVQRPGGVDDEFNTGALRFNTDLGVEYYNGSTWIQLVLSHTAQSQLQQTLLWW